MIAFAPWQMLLDAIGWVLAQIYSVIPNYGLSIIILTLVIKLLLLLLAVALLLAGIYFQRVMPKPFKIPVALGNVAVTVPPLKGETK